MTLSLVSPCNLHLWIFSFFFSLFIIFIVHCDQAPEIYMGSHRHGTAADWFAVGVTIHEFVCGRRPFEASRLQACRTAEVVDPLALDFLESCYFLSSDCKDFIAKLLSNKVYICWSVVL